MAVASWASFLYPGSNVLVNKAGIKDQSKLDNFERDASIVRTRELKTSPVQGNYDIAHLQSVHARIFQDVYDWAGQLRTVDMAKGNSKGLIAFTLVDDMPKGVADINKTIKESNYLRGLDQKEFSTKMAGLFKQVNDLHPFREGNGRATRAFLGQLAEDAGYSLNYSKVNRVEWNSASKESARGNLEPIKAVFNQIVTVPRALAFDRAVEAGKLERSVVLANHPELDGAFNLIHKARLEGKDVSAVKSEVSKQLHLGKIVDGGVTTAESLKVIEYSAKKQGLTTHDSGSLGTKHAGTIVAQSTHHMLLKVDDKNAIVFDRKTLAQNINLQVGNKLTLQHQVFKLDKSQDISASKGLERTQPSR